MRVLVAVLSLTALAGAAPAPAAPAVHAALIVGTGQVSVTCDTSAYPAAAYPCDLVITAATGACREVSAAGVLTSCSLAVRGPLRATPSPNPVGRCVINGTVEGVTTTFDSGADPALHVERRDIVQVLPEAGAYVLSGEAKTGFTVVVAAPYVIADILPDPMAGALAAPVRFTDLEHDCRTRAGGDPSSVPYLWPAGALTFPRTG